MNILADDDIAFIDDSSDNNNNNVIPNEPIDRKRLSKKRENNSNRRNEHEFHQSHELSLSSDDTVFLNLPPTCSQSMPMLHSISTAVESDGGQAIVDDSQNCKNNESSTSTTPVPTASLTGAVAKLPTNDGSDSSTTSTPINDPYNSYTELSSTDEDTSFYRDKCSMISSTFSRERPKPSKYYYAANRGAYISITHTHTLAHLFFTWIFPPPFHLNIKPNKQKIIFTLIFALSFAL